MESLPAPLLIRLALVSPVIVSLPEPVVTFSMLTIESTFVLAVTVTFVAVLPLSVTARFVVTAL